MERVQRNTNAGIIFFTAFYAIFRKIISSCLTENNSHFHFSCSVLELQCVLSVIEHCVLPFGPLTGCAPHQQREAFRRAPCWYIHVPIGRLWQARWDIMVKKMKVIFLLGSALSPGLQLSSCECIWVYNLREYKVFACCTSRLIYFYFSFYYSVFVVVTVLMINASPSTDLVNCLVFLFKYCQKFEYFISPAATFLMSFNSFIDFCWNDHHSRLCYRAVWSGSQLH